MGILILIPARGGSKRLKDKNLRRLGGMPLINWSINTAKDLKLCANILVSTDSEKLAEIATKEGVMVPWLRPDELSTDQASSVDVAIHAIEWHEQNLGPIDTLILLQPTSPFRKIKTIRSAIERYNEGYDAMIGVTKAKTHPLWAFRNVDGRLEPYCKHDGLGIRSQDLPDAYQVNGSLYIINADVLKSKKTFFPTGAGMCLMDEIESLDIDTMDDLNAARNILRSRNCLV